MANWLEGAGKSSMVSDANTVLQGAMGMRNQETNEAVASSKLKMSQEQWAAEKPGVEAQSAMSQETLAAYKKQRAFLATPVRLKENPYLTNMLGPEGAAQAAQDIEAMGLAKDGLTDVEKFGKAVTTILGDDAKWAGYRTRAVQYHSTMLNNAAEKVEKLKEKAASNPGDPKLFKDLEAAQAEEKTLRDKATAVDKNLLTVDNQREMQKILHGIRDEGPEGARIFKTLERDPNVKISVAHGDVEGFKKAVENARKTKLVPVKNPDGSITYESVFDARGTEPAPSADTTSKGTTAERVAKIAADARKESARLRGEAAKEKATKADDTKNQKVVLDQFKSDAKSIIDKYKMTGVNTQQMVKNAETGQFELAKQSLAPKEYQKFVNEITAARKRYDDRYEKKWNERPFGTTKSGAASGPTRLKFDAEGNPVE